METKVWENSGRAGGTDCREEFWTEYTAFCDEIHEISKCQSLAYARRIVRGQPGTQAIRGLAMAGQPWIPGWPGCVQGQRGIQAIRGWPVPSRDNPPCVKFPTVHSRDHILDSIIFLIRPPNYARFMPRMNRAGWFGGYAWL